MPFASRRTNVFVCVALALVLLVSYVADALPVAAPCPRHVQGVLLSRQYDNCLRHLGADQPSDASSLPFVFTPANARALHANVHCTRALTEMLAVTPSKPCMARLSENGDHRVLVESDQLNWIANHPSSKQAAVTRRLSSGTLWHYRYSCHFDTKQPFNTDSDMTEEFEILCGQTTGTFWTWVGYIALGLVGLAVLFVLVVWLMTCRDEDPKANDDDDTKRSTTATELVA